ncbi:MAG: hypothetical protein JW925_14095 [Syntrophaceae bacterium]|nr:hypothetical protein [Syntrophaceae bacterium]
MNFEVSLVYSGKKANIYTIRFKDEDKSEFFRFLDDYIGHSEIDEILRRLQNISELYGMKKEWFRQESRNPDIGRILLSSGLLRLFCIRYGDDVIILGYGGVKDPEKQKLDDNPDLHEVVQKLETIYENLSYFMKKNGLLIKEFLELFSK